MPTEGESPPTIHELPTELLILIFFHGSASDASAPILPSFKPFPLSISRVCNLWRSIVLSNPRLWTTVVSSHHVPYFPILKLQLQRAGNHPLNLFVDFDTPLTWSPGDLNNLLPPERHGHSIEKDEYGVNDWLTDADIARIRLQFLILGRRIRTFHLCSDVYANIFVALSSLPLVISPDTPDVSALEKQIRPDLEELSVQYRGFDGFTRGDGVFLNINDGFASNLRRLNLGTLGLPWATTGGSLNSLTTLELSNATVRPWLTISALRSILLPNNTLKILSLNNVLPVSHQDEWDLRWPADEVVTFLALRKLVLVRENTDSLEALLQRLRLPALRHLELDLPLHHAGPNRTLETTHDRLVNLLLPFTSQLEILRLEAIHCSDDIICDFVVRLTNLRALTVNFDLIMDSSDTYTSMVPWIVGECLSSPLPSTNSIVEGQKVRYLPNLEVLLLNAGPPDLSEVLRCRQGARELQVYLGEWSQLERYTIVCDDYDGAALENVENDNATGNDLDHSCVPVEWGRSSAEVWSNFGESQVHLFDLEAFLRYVGY